LAAAEHPSPQAFALLTKLSPSLLLEFRGTCILWELTNHPPHITYIELLALEIILLFFVKKEKRDKPKNKQMLKLP
jgi:hypothetical protein